MTSFSSDLALETAEQLGITGKGAEKLPGVSVSTRRCEGYALTAISLQRGPGSHALGRPPGRYITVDLQPYFQRRSHYFPRGVRCLSRELRALLPRLGRKDTVLVVGLGNRRLACDAVGPAAVDNLLITRHMALPFRHFTPVAALAAGVVGQTGIETLDLIAGAVGRISPAAVIAVDALCACSRHRLCATVQLSNTGLVPGSGVGNHRRAIDRATLGVPVISVGVPTVISGATLARELTGLEEQERSDLFLTPRDVTSRVAELGRLIGFSITAALQPDLTVEEITGLLG